MTDSAGSLTGQPAGGQPEPPAGWYPDPSDRSRQRWWDGYVWGDQTRPLPSATASAYPDGPRDEQSQLRTAHMQQARAAADGRARHARPGRQEDQQRQGDAARDISGSAQHHGPSYGQPMSPAPLPQPVPAGAPQPGMAPAAAKRPNWIRRHRLLSAVIGAIVLLVAVIGILGARGVNTAASGCWYIPSGPTAHPGALAVHLPLCDGANANLQRTVIVNPGNMIPGSEPANAKEICQMEIGDGPTGWIGVWADSTIRSALGAAQGLCQLDVNSSGHVRWSNFH